MTIVPAIVRCSHLINSRSLASACQSVLGPIAANAPNRTRLRRYRDGEACDLARCPIELAPVGSEEALS